jgi:hypothetical protein
MTALPHPSFERPLHGRIEQPALPSLMQRSRCVVPMYRKPSANTTTSAATDTQTHRTVTTVFDRADVRPDTVSLRTEARPATESRRAGGPGPDRRRQAASGSRKRFERFDQFGGADIGERRA